MSSESGAVMVEMAFVIVLLFFVLLAIVDFGKAFNYWNDATHISAEGARYAAVNNKPHPGLADSLQAQLQGQADTTELRDGGTSDVTSPSEVCIDFPNGTSGRGDPVRVTQSEVTSTAIMRLETAATNYTAGCV